MATLQREPGSRPIKLIGFCRITLALNRTAAAENFDEPLRLDMMDGVSEGSKLDNFAVLSDWNEHEGSNSLVKDRNR